MNWNNKEDVKEYYKKYMRVWRSNPENYSKLLQRSRNYKKNHREEMNNYNEKYRASKHGKEVRLKAQTKRERNLSWVKMFANPFDTFIEIEWHHITDVYVVALPKDLHRLYTGKHHREKVMSIVKQIYM